MTSQPPWEPMPGDSQPHGQPQHGQPSHGQPPHDQPPSGQPPSGPPTWDPAAQYSGGPVYQAFPYPGQAPQSGPGGMPGGPWHVPAYLDPTDPLVPPPGGGFDAWFSRLTATLRRSWRSLLVVLGLTHALPSVVFGVFALVYIGAFTSVYSLNQPATGADAPGAAFGGFLVLAIAFAVVISLAQSLGYAAATWVVAREAAGEPAPLGEAMRYGLGRMVGLWGWTLAYGIIVGVGLCLCILPGVYFGLALALFGPVYVFERENPLGRAWRMFHDNFGPVLGRVALVAASVVAVQVVVSLLQNIATVAGGGPDSTAAAAISLVIGLFGVVVMLVPTMIQVVGLVITYAEQRVRQGPLATRQLAAELG